MSIMRNVSILIITLGMSILAGCSTPTTSSQNEKAEAEVLAALQDFQASYKLKDVNKISDHFNNPTTLIAPQGVSVTVAKKEFNEVFGPVVNYLENAEYAHSEWRNVDVKVLDNDLAIASADVTQYDINDQVIENFGVTYSMSHDGKGWKISAITTHPPSDLNQEK